MVVRVKSLQELMVDQKNPRNEQARQATINRLLEAAEYLFSRQGYSATTMQQIVKRAGTSIGNAYFYFSNKSHLLQAVVARAIQDRWRVADRYLETFEMPVEKLAVSLYLNTLPAVAGKVQFIHVSGDEIDYAVADAFQDILRQRYRRLLSAWFPKLDDDDREFMIYGWLGTGRGIITAKITGAYDIPPLELARRVVRWDLRAAGFSEDKVALGIGAIDRLEQSEAWRQSLFDGQAGGSSNEDGVRGETEAQEGGLPGRDGG